MKQVYFATQNKAKVSAVNAVLSKHGIEAIHIPMDLSEPRTDDLREIAKYKVLAAYQEIKKPVIAVDSGFFVHALNGFPRAFVNFALETIGVDGIVKLMESKPRQCEFRTCLAYYNGSQKEPIFFEANTDGMIADSPAGEVRDFAWSKLALIFIPAGKEKTLAQMSEEEYNRWREESLENSFAEKFARWYLEN